MTVGDGGQVIGTVIAAYHRYNRQLSLSRQA